MQIHKDNSIEKKKYEWKLNLKGQDYKQCEWTFQEYDINCKVAPIFTLSMIYCTFGLKNNSDWKKWYTGTFSLLGLLFFPNWVNICILDKF